MKKTNLFLFLVTILFGSCNKDLRLKGPETDNNDMIPVCFLLSEQRGFTRSTSSIVTLTSGETIKVCVSKDGGSSYTGYDFTAASTSQTPVLTAPSGDKPYFPVGNGTTVKTYAYYPSTAGSSSTFTVQSNQTSDQHYKASDLMYCAEQTVTKPNSATLNMAHKMVQLKLSINPTLGSGLPINRVLVNAKNTVSFTPSSGATTTQPSKSDIVAMTSSGTGYVIIPVQQISDITIKIETGSANDASTTAIFSFTSTDYFTAGYSYPIDISFGNSQLGQNTVISGWNGESNIIVEIPERDIKQNPLWYMAPYNMSSATTMASTENAGYYYVWSDAMTYFGAQTTSYSAYKRAGKTIEGQSGTWHYPVKGEWVSIAPTESTTSIFSYVNSSNRTAYKASFVTPIFGYNTSTKAGISESSYFVYVSSTELHAIRFLGTDYCSAWKWITQSNQLTIYATLIEKVANNSASASAWYTNNWNSVTFGNVESEFAVMRTLYPRGYNSSGSNASSNSSLGINGYYSSATESGNDYCWHLGFANSSVYLQSGWYKNHARAIRLFRDN